MTSGNWTGQNVMQSGHGRRFEKNGFDPETPCCLHILLLVVDKDNLFRSEVDLFQDMVEEARVWLTHANLARSKYTIEERPVHLP